MPLYRELRRDLIITRIISDFKSVGPAPYHQTARKILNLLINRALDSKDFSLVSFFYFSDFSRTSILTTSASSISSHSLSSLSHCAVLIGPLVEW